MIESMDNTSRQRLRSFVERIERLDEEKKALSEDMKLVYQEAKSEGFDTKTMRKLVALRKQDANDLAEEAALLELYCGAMGMLEGTPLGIFAKSQEPEPEKPKRGRPKKKASEPPKITLSTGGKDAGQGAAAR